jgi:hypothetical protein
LGNVDLLQGKLEAGEEILEAPCKKCGDIVSTSFIEPMCSKIKESGLCFTCVLWQDRVPLAKKSKLDDGRIVVVFNHEYYTCYPSIDKSKNNQMFFVGHGGAKFEFVMIDGSIVRSNNVWSGGNVPPEFYEDIPDTAKSMTNY